MEAPFPGVGTLINIATVLVGGVAGMTMGHRLPERVRSVVTDCLGLVTLLIAAVSALAVLDPPLEAEVGAGVPTLVVLGSMLIGGIIGSLLLIEQRLEGLAGVVQDYVARRTPQRAEAEEGGLTARERFIEGWLTTSLLFCVGPLTILGSLNDGLGRGIDELVLKSVLDGFAAMAFASTLGVGVLFSAVSIGVVQGSLTVVGVLLGSVVPDPHISALTAVGGLLLVGVGLRLLRMKDIPVGDLLPALAVAPVLVWLVGSLT
jgi:uncharacterized membrane protein YqgA involved in biofilm formation